MSGTPLDDYGFKTYLGNTIAADRFVYLKKKKNE